MAFFFQTALCRRMKMMRFALYLLIFCLSINKLYAIGFEDGVFPELITSARGLAMGNAYISKVDDSHSAFYNPAGLGSVRDSHFHLTNVHVETNSDFNDVVGSGNGADQIAKKAAKTYTIDGLRQLLVDNKGKILHARAHTFPNLTFKYFSMGYMASKRIRATVEDTDGAQLEYADRLDHGPVTSANASLWGGVVKFGASAVYLQRSELLGTANPNTEVQIDGSQYKKGSMFYVTGGSKLTLPIAFLPTFSAVLRNATSSKFQKTGGPDAPDKIQQTVDLGFSLTPQLGKRSRIHLEYNLKDSANKYDNPANRRSTFGIEIDFSRIFFIRGGYGDGFGSGGIGLKTNILEVDITTYAVDTSTATFKGKEDRRFVFGFSAGF